MANKVGQLNCSTNRKNTGYSSCFLDLKLVAGAFLFDTAKSFTDNEIAALQTTLQNLAKADAKSARMFPFHKFVAATDNTEDLIVQNFDYGAKYPVRDGDYDWRFQFVDGGLCLSNSARSHNGPAFALFYDKDYKLVGCYDQNNKLSTIPLQFFYAHPWKLPTGSATAVYMLQFVFLAKYLNEQIAFVKADFDLSEIKGLQDVDIVVNSFNQNTGVANVTLQTRCGAVNIYDDFSTNIDETIFGALDDEGNDVAVSSVSPVSGSKSFDVTLDTGDFPDSGIVTLSGNAPSVLSGKDIDGYEIGSAELTIEGS